MCWFEPGSWFGSGRGLDGFADFCIYVIWVVLCGVVGLAVGFVLLWFGIIYLSGWLSGVLVDGGAWATGWWAGWCVRLLCLCCAF